LHVFDSTNTEVKVIDTAAHPITALASNGKIVAAGNGHRYVFVFDGQTLTEIFNSGDLKDKILDLYINEEGLIGSACHDLSFGLYSLEEKKLTWSVKMPHGAKMVTNVVIKDNSHLITAGEDCSLK